jgi:hypothetical protein
MKKFAVFTCLSLVCSGLAQSSGTPTENSPPKPLEVSLQILSNGTILHDGDTLRAPADLWIHADIMSAVAGHAGDSMTVDFFANTNRLGSRKYAWQDKIEPDPHSLKPQPMIIVAAGFYGGDIVWSNAPAGSYALTARACGWHGHSDVSVPINITISSPHP